MGVIVAVVEEGAVLVVVTVVDRALLSSAEVKVVEEIVLMTDVALEVDVMSRDLAGAVALVVSGDGATSVVAIPVPVVAYVAEDNVVAMDDDDDVVDRPTNRL